MKNIFYGISTCLVLLSSCHLKEMKDKDEIDWSKYPIVELSDPTRISIPVRDFEAEQKLYLVRDSLLFTYATFSQLSELHLYRLQRDTLFWQRLLTQKGQGPLETCKMGEFMNCLMEQSYWFLLVIKLRFLHFLLSSINCHR